MEEDRVIDGLFQKLECSRSECLRTSGNVAVCGKEEDGHLNAALSQTPLNFQAVHLGHPNINHQASPLPFAATVRLQELPA
jgi:hypothetical protein